MMSMLPSRMLRQRTALAAVRGLRTGSRVMVELKDKERPMTVNAVLPDPMAGRRKRIAAFAAFSLATGSALAVIFNYEKTESAIVSNTMYYMRRSGQTIDALGENIEFAGVIPWVWGELNPVAGKINITFSVKGKKGVTGIVKLVADRENRREEFRIHEWSLTVPDKKIDLLAENPHSSFD
ncbi:uncharacterized protein HLK63_H06787 [Nakaseomyces glabratus]|nr:uncharacterized protein GW608_H06787 [Nakaseomyces glabratus]UCS26302.1 uncharacterized protein HLK63_H06787 [Nakaseomyces glabratus]UCS31532.1 uncharacterized protein HLK64_H06787 [Nakaseomyces glabratus]UCS36760.1 uncharacterized protein HLK62_H06787 [Nakaseomyces glabratus]